MTLDAFCACQVCRIQAALNALEQQIRRRQVRREQEEERRRLFQLVGGYSPGGLLQIREYYERRVIGE